MSNFELIEAIRFESGSLRGYQERAILKIMQANLEGEVKGLRGFEQLVGAKVNELSLRVAPKGIARAGVLAVLAFGIPIGFTATVQADELSEITAMCKGANNIVNTYAFDLQKEVVNIESSQHGVLSQGVKVVRHESKAINNIYQVSTHNLDPKSSFQFYTNYYISLNHHTLSIEQATINDGALSMTYRGAPIDCIITSK